MNAAIEANTDLALERAVLGQVLTFGLWQAFADSGLKAVDFFGPQHRTIWTAAQAIHDEGGTADVVSISRRLTTEGTIAEVGHPYLGRIAEGIPRPSDGNITIAVADLQCLAAGREVSYAAELLAKRLTQPGAIADGAIAQHIDAVQAIAERSQSVAPLWLDVERQLVAHQADVTIDTTQKVFFGLPELDDAIGGVRVGEVCGLMGRPGIGKTLLLSHIARAVTETCGHVVFSLEMPASQIVGRLKQMVYGLGRWELERATRQGQLDEDLYRHAFRNLIIVDTPSMSISEMRRRFRQIQKGPLAGVPVNLITIDHLGLVGGDRNMTTYDRVSTQAREIKEFAKAAGCGVLLAIQVNREAGGDGSRELGLGSARDSGVVEEAMDYLIGIRRLDRSLTLSPFERERYKDVIFAKVIKNRHESPDGKEIAYRFNPRGLELRGDPSIQAEENDLSRIAAPRGRR